MKKRLLAIILVVCLCAALLPAVAMAEGGLTEDQLFSGALPASYGAVEFELDGEAYYMGLANWSENGVSADDGIAVPRSHDATASGVTNPYNVNRCIGFWKEDGKTKVSAAELEAIKTAFTGLDIKLQSVDNTPSAYPTVESKTSPAGWPCAAAYSFPRAACEGKWIFTVSGRLGGVTYTAYALQEIEVIDPEKYDATLLPSDADVISEVNDALEIIAGSEGYNSQEGYLVLLPNRNMTGIIEIPENMGSVIILALDGATINGGVVANNYSCLIEGITFIGAGAEKDEWEGGVNDGKENVAFSGTAYGQTNYCSFTGFNVAVRQESGVRTGGEGNRYKDNRIGILVEATRTGDGNCDLGWSTFEKNEVAVQFESGVTNVQMYLFINTCFIDNTDDIINRTGSKYFLPGNYIEHNSSYTEGLDTNKYVEGHVYLTPGATDNTFTSFYFPKGGNAVMSTANTGKYKIKSSDLSGTFTVIDNANAEDEATVTLDFGEAQPVAQTYSLRRMRAVENEFDATVTITKAENSITVSIKEIPDGKTPTVTLECGDWCGAEVTSEDGEVSGVSFASKKVSFIALEGGPHTYTITPANANHRWNRGEVTKAPTYTETGKILFSCSSCDAAKEETLPKLVYSAPAEPEIAPPFTDIPAGSYYEDAVKWAYNNDITTGVTETTFDPKADCQRAQVITFLWRAAGCPESSGTGADLGDVKAGTYYEKAVKWAIEKGITNGLGADTFGVSTDVTRAQFVTFLWRYAGCPKPLGTKDFADVTDGAYYSDAVIWAAENGITDGVGGGNFAPGETCTRAQIVTFLYRYFG